jgi:mevalonate kinase
MTRLRAGSPFGLIIADTGKASSTRHVVGHVRSRWEADPDRYQRLFDQIGDVARQARTAIEEGDRHAIGRLMAQNHHLLVALGVSSPDLDRLVGVAREAGATGAKMSGAGWGGNVLALAEPHATPNVTDALRDAGAAPIISTTVV